VRVCVAGRKKSTAEAKAADLPVDPFACDTSDAEVKATSKRPSEEKRKDTAKKAKIDCTKKVASQEKTGENHKERVSTLSVEAVKKVGHLSNRCECAQCVNIYVCVSVCARHAHTRTN